MTPMGAGYVLYLRLPDSSYTYTLTGENGENLQNIFHKENQIYWLPDGTGNNLRYENGDTIKLPSVEKSLIQINVHSDDTKIITFELCLQKETDDGCSVTLTKISC